MLVIADLIGFGRDLGCDEGGCEMCNEIDEDVPSRGPTSVLRMWL